jgi:Family of unknown function (DUF6390)
VRPAIRASAASPGSPFRAEARGPVLFARYAYPPNALGYCGPSDPAALWGAAAEADDLRGLSALAARFEGAWPYLQLIAACNGIPDPLDRRVVEAYWVGNRLLERVPSGLLIASLEDRFGRRTRGDFEAIASAVPRGAVAHHSFHVFGVYPWLGLLRAGMEGAPLTVLDRCRIRWGKVIACDGDTVTVCNRGLVLRGHRLVLGEERVEQANFAVDGTALVDALAPGDTVSLHWDWVCDRLSPIGVKRLRAYTARVLRAVNSLPAPGPAVACDRRGG